MCERMSGMNKFGICEWSLPISGPCAIQLAGEIGYNGIQLGEAGGASMGFPLNNKRVQEIYMESSSAYKVEFQALNLGALLSSGDMNFPRGNSRGDMADLSLRKGFEACKALKVPKVVITFDSDNEETFVNNLYHVRYAEKLSQETGVGITVETAMTLPRIMRMLEEISPDDGICMDLLNPLRFGTGDPIEQIQAFGDRIDHFHLKDSTKDLFIKGQRGCVLLGTGNAGLESSIRLIKELRLQGWFITENYYQFPPMNDGNKDFISLASLDLEYMRNMLNEY